MHKKAQIMVFFIVGIILIATVLIATQLSEQNSSFDSTIGKQAELSGRAGDLNQFVASCLDEIASSAVYDVSLQGGYYAAPELSLPYYYIHIPYYWHNEENHMPTLVEVEEQLGTYVSNNLEFCINNFDALRLIGYDIADEQPTATASIREKTIAFELNYPISLQTDEGTFTFDRFATSIDVNYGDIYSHAVSIMLKQQQIAEDGDGHLLPTGFITALAYDNGFSYEVVDIEGSEDVIIGLVYPVEQGEDLLFVFANNYGELEYVELLEEFVLESGFVEEEYG